MTHDDFIASYPALLAKHGSQRAVSRATGIPRSTIQDWLDRAPTMPTQVPAPPIVVKPSRGRTQRFIFTSAQTATPVHGGFLRNLEAYAAARDAKLVISGFSYNKRLFESHAKDDSDAHYDPRVVPYLMQQRYEIGNRLWFCGEMNTLPTAVSPLSGFEVYTRDKWGIFPHAKVQLVSVPTMKHDPAKIIMTTGAVTMPNYVQKRAGILAHFHHVFGAVLVEIDSAGRHFCRHLLGDEATGDFQDLTYKVVGGKVTDGHRVEAINWGDIHMGSLDLDVLIGGFCRDTGMLDWLKPRFQFLHDVTDFKVRNHHNIKDPHFRLKMHHSATDSVQEELQGVADFIARAQRPWCTTVVVESNHDLAMLTWLKEHDWRTDPVNARFFLEAQLAAVKAIENGEDFSPLRWAMERLSGEAGEAVYLREDDSFTICGGEIECGMHGHLGANGAKGSPKQFSRMGPKANTGHTHSASIIDGIFTAGTSSLLNMGYNKGLSSWSHSHIVTYPNGKRTIVTMRDGLWCAE